MVITIVIVAVFLVGIYGWALGGWKLSVSIMSITLLAALILWRSMKRRRITYHYVTTRKGNSIELHHEPIFFFHKTTKSQFLALRQKAMKTLIVRLETEGNDGIQEVISSSSWLPYESNWEITECTPTVQERISAFLSVIANLENWKLQRLRRIWFRLKTSPFKHARISIVDFKEIEGDEL